MTGKKKPTTPKSFPLRWHKGVSQFYKWHKGKQHYFGSDAATALERFNRDWPHILAGQERPIAGELSVRDLCNRYLSIREKLVESGSIKQRTFDENLSLCRLVAEAIGAKTVKLLTPEDFRKVRSCLSSSSPQILAKRIAIVRGLFTWALREGIIDHPPKYGAAMDGPSKSEIRRYRAKLVKPIFTAAEIRAFLDGSDSLLRALILMGLNCGLYAADLSELQHRHIDGEWLDYARLKTGIERRAWLWPETRSAMAEVSTDPKASEFVFLGPRGGKLVRPIKGGRADAVANMFARLKKRLGYTRSNSGFRGLRHTFRTVADSCGDQPAIVLAMGHADNSISAVYRHSIDDSRLIAVAEHVRRWLWPELTE